MMKINQIGTTEATITLSGTELMILNNALNETLEALGDDPGEFETRVGATMEEVEALLDSINPLAQQVG